MGGRRIRVAPGTTSHGLLIASKRRFIARDTSLTRVIIYAKSDMIDADPLNDRIDVRNKLIERRSNSACYHAREPGDTDESARTTNSIDQLILCVASAVVHGRRIGMRKHDRRCRMVDRF